ncbi:hypothetical protein IWW36_003576 [Coemansia brasiliensis]|uniref:Uncharacterized protein n=1 Tax=Coemansia brasiliensis TaxID=2650707 RepID=A0A9W8LZM8_9FUNG|nr:hypothetical protein IWW36_003576 [Coemansia brasiliensis]
MDKKLDTVSQQADQVRELIDRLRERVAEGELSTASGLSFLEVKHHTMLSYLSNLSFLTLLKLHGRQLQGHQVVKNLVEDRTVLEKMKPLEQRLKYQIDKLLQTAITSSESSIREQLGTTDDPEKAPVSDDRAKLAAAMLSEDALADPSAFKPNPSQLAKDVREEDLAAMESGVYRAPKQTPVHYEEDNAVSQRERTEQRMMERAARSRLVQDLMTEYDDRPETSTASGNPSVGLQDSRMERLANERARYEEENFTRLAMNKKERKGLRKKLTDLDDEFAHLNDFAGMAGLRKSAELSESKAAILDRIQQRKRDNESMAEKVMRRRKRRNDSDDEFVAREMSRNHKTKFKKASRRVAKR